MGYITKDGAEGLRQYQYRGRDLSLVYKYVLTPMNNVLINWIPLWMAPNVVTMIGVIASLSSYFLLQYYCPTLEGPAPWWVFVYDAVATFTYQTLDNLDGKQARRTGSSSPLGMLFDHGCDALNTTLQAFNQACTLQVGPSWMALCMWQWVTVPFFFTTLEELYTGELVLPIVNGPTEGIICLCLSKLFTAYVGASFWLEPNFLFPQYANNVALMFPMAVLSMCCLVINFRIIYKSKHRKDSMFAVALQVLPYMTMQTLLALWMMNSNLMKEHPRMFIWLGGLLFAKNVMHLMLAHICEQQFSPLRRTFITVLVVATWLGLVSWHSGLSAYDPLHTYTLYGLLGITVISYSHFVISVINECCAILKINCFRIAAPKKAQ